MQSTYLTNTDPELAKLRAKANQATLREAAEILGVKRDRLYKAVERGCIPHRQERRLKNCVYRYTIIVDLEDVQAWLDTNQHTRGKAMLEDWERGSSPEEIAKAFKIKTVSVIRALQRQGVPVTERDRTKRRSTL